MRNLKLRVTLVALVVVMAACSSGGGDDDDAPTTAARPTLDAAACRDAPTEAVAPAQTFIDGLADVAVEELAAMDPPPDFAAVQTDVQARAQEAVGGGCDPVQFEQQVQAAIEKLTGEGEVGGAIAAVLRGDAEAEGVTTGSSVPRDEAASPVTVRPGDDLGAIVARVGSGSTISLATGTFELDQTLVVDVDLRFVGAARERTIVESSATGLAVAFVGPGGLEMTDLARRHVGDEPASVLLAIEGPATLRDAEFSGAVAGAEDEGGGHGVVFGFDPLPGFPERTDEERAGGWSSRTPR